MARCATEVDFVKLSPTRNTTLLVTSRHAVGDYRSIATQLLSTEHVHAEQVGFVGAPTSTGARLSLHMAGDEFCGNACMALAAMTAAELGLVIGDRTEIVLDASGTQERVTCLVEHRDPDGYYCTLTMPSPIRVEAYPFPGAPVDRTALVRYPDAVHLVVECAEHDQTTRDRALMMARHLGATQGVAVVGVMLYDPDLTQLTPLVNVPSLSSMVWERSCGSGTAALGAYLATRSQRPVRTSVHQPGGTMTVEAMRGLDGRIRIRIGGHVEVVAEGTAYVHV